MKNIKIKNILFLISIILFLISKPLPLQAKVSSQILFEKALQESREGDFIEAKKDWNLFITENPQDAAALSNRGNILLALGDPEAAIRDQTKAIEISPDELDPYVNRGIAQEALEHWEEAADDYKWVLKQNPDNSSALYNLANVMGSMGNWSEAERLFHEASSARTGFAMARSSEALSIYQLGDVDLAEAKIRLLIRKYPLFADARAALSAILWRKGLFGEAESNWAAAAGLDIRYREMDWVLNVRRWPPSPTNDLFAFLALEDR